MEYTILVDAPPVLRVHFPTTRFIPARMFPELRHRGRHYVLFTLAFRSPQTASFSGKLAGYEAEYRPLREGRLL